MSINGEKQFGVDSRQQKIKKWDGFLATMLIHTSDFHHNSLHRTLLNTPPAIQGRILDQRNIRESRGQAMVMCSLIIPFLHKTHRLLLLLLLLFCALFVYDWGDTRPQEYLCLRVTEATGQKNSTTAVLLYRNSRVFTRGCLTKLTGWKTFRELSCVMTLI